MTRFDKVLNVLVWLLGASATLMFLIFCWTTIHGCSPAATECPAAKSPPQADWCIAKANDLVEASPTCKVAFRRLNAFLERDPDCVAVVKKTITFDCHDADGGGE